MAEIVIRRAEPGDYAGFARTFTGPSAAAGTLQNPYPSEAQWKERLAANTERNQVFVALVDGAIVGNGGLHGNANPRRAHCWGLGLTVHDDWQGKGIGTRLMETMIDLADHWLGALRLELTVYTDNARAIRVYQKFGFTIEGTHRAFALREGVYVDALAMARLHPSPPQLPRTP